MFEIIALVGGLAFVLTLASRPLYCLLVLSALAASSWVVPPSLVDGVRITSLLTVAFWLVAHPSKRSAQEKPPARSSDVKWAIGGYLLFVFAATVPHGDVTNLASHLVGLALLVPCLHFLFRRLSGHPEVLALASAILFGATLVSLGAVALGSSAYSGERLRGLFINPNTLGFVCFVGFALSTVAARRHHFLASVMALSFLSCMLLSGSRMSLLATGVFVLVDGVQRPGRGRLTLGLALLTTFTLVLNPSLLEVLPSETTRTNDSRSDGIAYAVNAFRDAPIFGLGYAADHVEVASSPGRALLLGGAIGVIGLACIYVAILRASAKISPSALALGVAAVVHSFGEGWLLSAVGPLMLVFAVAMAAISVYEWRPLPLKQPLDAHYSPPSHGAVGALPPDRTT